MNTNTNTANTANTTSANTTSAITPTPLTNSLAVKDNLAEQLALLGENLGQFKAYDSQLPLVEIAGTRIVKCLYQASPKTGEKAQENAYVRLPVKHLTEEHIVSRITELSPYVLGWLQSLEDVMIKADHKAGTTQVFTEFLSLDKLLGYLEETSTSGRLNKEKIGEWFTTNLEDELSGLFAAKLGYSIENLDAATEAELLKLAKVVNAYKVKFELLASPKCYFNEADCLAMTKVITSVETAKNSVIGTRFVARLAKMQEKQEEVLLEL